MTQDQIETVRQMRQAGYAIIIFGPEELRGVDPDMVQDMARSRGNDAIDSHAMPTAEEIADIHAARGDIAGQLNTQTA